MSIEITEDPFLLAEIHFQTTTTAYREIFPPDAPPPTVQQLAALWEERLADQDTCAMVASHQGKPVGAVGIRLDPEFDDEGQLLALHVLPDRWGRGYGSALHDAALQTLKAQEFLKAGLWVLAANDRARRMYEGRGWILRPGVELDYLGVREVRYTRTV